MQVVAALALGCLFAAAYRSQARRSTGSLVAALALLPPIVSVVIMMVSGSLGAGIAVAGAFNLVRFRSAPGTAREIVAIFMSMAIGLVCGMGCVGYAAAVTALACVVTVAAGAILRRSGERMTLRVTVPESLDYDGVFDAALDRHASSWSLSSVKTTNMGTLYKLTYDVELRDPSGSRAMLDDIRTLNGNLEVALSRGEAGYEL